MFDEYEKPKIFRRKDKRKYNRSSEVPDNEREHPVHRPYSRDNKGNLRHSLVIDGLGESDIYKDEDEDS